MSDMTLTEIAELAERLNDRTLEDVTYDPSVPPKLRYKTIPDPVCARAASALRQLLNAQKWREIETAPQNIAFADVWSITTRDGNIVCQMRVPNAQHRDGKWYDGGGYEINRDVMEMDDVHYVRKVTHFMEQPLPPSPEEEKVDA